MDAYHYDKIADKLIQFRSQLSTFGHLDDIKAQWTIDHMTNKRLDYYNARIIGASSSRVKEIFE